MTNVVDRDVVVLAPEERHSVEFLALPQHIAGGGLPLTLSDHPMLDPDILARMRIGPSRYIASGEDAGDAGLEMGVHDDPAIERAPPSRRARRMGAPRCPP